MNRHEDEDQRRRWMIARTVAGLLAAGPLLALSPSTEAAAPARTAPAAKAKAAPRARLTSLPRATPQSRITMDFRDAPIDQILNFFSVVSGLTVIKDPGLQGTATLISPRPVTVKDALDILSALLESRGFRLERTPTLLRITSSGGRGGRGGRPGGGNDAPGGFPGFGGRRSTDQTRVFQLQYARAQGIATIVNDLFRNAANNRGGRGNNNNNNGNNNNNAAPVDMARASADEYSNSVVVMGPTTQLDLIADVIQQVDKPIGTKGVTQVFPIRYIDATEMGTVISNVLIANAQEGSATTPLNFEQRINGGGRNRRGNNASNNPQVVPSTTTNSIIVTATEAELDLVQAVLKELDKPVPVQSTTFVRTLKNASASEVATMLNQIYSRNRNGNFGNFNTGNNRNGNFGNNNRNNNRNTGFGNTNRNNTGNRSFGNMRGSADAEAGPRIPGTSVPKILPAAAHTGGVKVIPAVADVSGSGPADAGAADTPGPSLASTLPPGPPLAPAKNPFNPNVMLAQGPGGGFPFGGGFPGGGFFGGFNNQNRTGVGGTANQNLQTQAVPDVNTNSLIISADPAVMAALDQILTSLDKAPEQVLIEAVIVEANLDKTNKLGFQFQWTNPHLGNNTVGSGSIGVNPTTLSPAGRYSIVGNGFSAILQSLATDNRFNILSTPRIFTANNREAQINISQRIPYVTGTVVTTTGATQTNVDYIDVGIILDVIPRITSNGLITIDVSQTANDFQGFTDFNAPLVAQRSTETTVVVQDGQTVIIGGLIRDTVTKNKNKVPILGDIPIIGSLFRSKDTQHQKTELMVFLTPHVVRTAQEISDLTERQRNELQYSPRVELSRPAPAPPIELPPVNPGPALPPVGQDTQDGNGAQPGAEADTNATDGGDEAPPVEAGPTPELPAPPDTPGAGAGAPPAPAPSPVEDGGP